MPDAPSNTPAPADPTTPATPTADVQRQLGDLADAVRELSKSHKTLLDSVNAASATPDASSEISGDPGDGLRPAAAVDYSRLSPLQQITLGLRDASLHRTPAPRTGAATDGRENGASGAD